MRGELLATKLTIDYTKHLLLIAKKTIVPPNIAYLDGKVLVGSLGLASGGDGAIGTNGKVLRVVALEGNLARARGVNLKLEALRVLDIGLVGLDLDTRADRDLLVLRVDNDKLGLAVLDAEELIAGDLGLGGLECAVGANAGQVV